jgi:hypothetical protein
MKLDEFKSLLYWWDTVNFSNPIGSWMLRCSTLDSNSSFQILDHDKVASTLAYFIIASLINNGCKKFYDTGLLK